MDYQSLNLTANLLPINSPINNMGGVSPYEYDSSIGRGYVSQSKLGNFSASYINGGTFSAGGTLNGDGVISVRRADGTEIVLIDNAGITINYGSITIKNGDNVTLIDSYGLIGTANFPFTQVTSAGTPTSTTSTTYSDISDMSVDIVAQRSQQVFFMCKLSGGDNNGDLTTIPASKCRFRLLLGTEQLGQVVSCKSIIHQGDTSLAYYFSDTVLTAIGTVAAGTTTAKLQYSTDTSGKSVRCVPSACSLAYFKMGA